MRRFILILLLCIAGASAPAQRVVRDTRFGQGGAVLIPDDSLKMNSNRIALQADGKIVVAGTYFYYEYPSFNKITILSIVRLMPDGRPDPDFNNGGHVVMDVSYRGRICSLMLQPDGCVIVTLSKGLFLRLTPVGAPDTLFGIGGAITYPALAQSAWTDNATMLRNGKIVVAAVEDADSLLLMRLNRNGSTDTSFGKGGKLYFRMADGSRAKAFCVREGTDGRLVVGGGSDSGIFVARFEEDGKLDTTFNKGRGFNASFNRDSLYSPATMCMRPDGKILIGGLNFDQEFNNDSSLIRYYIAALTTAGIRDSSFGINGLLNEEATSFPTGFSLLPNPVLRLQQNGKLLMGIMCGREIYHKQFCAKRYNTDGQPDTTFGPGGKLVMPVSQETDYLYDMAVQSDAKILFCGITGWDTAWPNPTHSTPTILRYRETSIPDDTADWLQVYPNPMANDYVMLRYRLTESGSLKLSMENMLGQTAGKWSFPSAAAGAVYEEQLRLPQGLPTGCYLLRAASHSLQRVIKVIRD